MDQLKELYRYKEQIEFELKQVAVFHHQRRKRFRSDQNARSKKRKFERALLLLKARWNRSINTVFRCIHDAGTYDKLAYDITKSFHTFLMKYNFDADQLAYAYRCVILPVAGQLMDEDELGQRAYERQERRKYFLRKLLSYGVQWSGNCGPEQRVDNQSVDDFVDVCSASPKRKTNESHNSPHAEKSKVESHDQQYIRHVKPTTVTIITVDILVEALLKCTKHITKDCTSGRNRIYHIMNIFHVVDITSRYLDEIKLQIEEDSQYGQMQDLDLGLLRQSLDKYETQIWEALNRFEVMHPMVVFKNQLDTLLLQIISIKPMLRR